MLFFNTSCGHLAIPGDCKRSLATRPVTVRSCCLLA